MGSRPDSVVDATAAHVRHVGERIRSEHLREMAQCGNRNPDLALRDCFCRSAVSYAVIADGNPIFCMGAEPAGALTKTSMVWMIGTDAIDRHPMTATAAARWGIGAAYRATGADHLEQWIPEWYETGLRFVRYFGFVCDGPVSGLIHVRHSRR